MIGAAPVDPRWPRSAARVSQARSGHRNDHRQHSRVRSREIHKVVASPIGTSRVEADPMRTVDSQWAAQVKLHTVSKISHVAPRTTPCSKDAQQRPTPTDSSSAWRSTGPQGAPSTAYPKPPVLVAARNISAGSTRNMCHCHASSSTNSPSTRSSPERRNAMCCVGSVRWQ